LCPTAEISWYRFGRRFCLRDPVFFYYRTHSPQRKIRSRFILLKAYLVSVIPEYVFTYL
jgi:hypothetical protein